MPPRISVLLIEDNRIEAHLTQHWLTSAANEKEFQVEWVDQLALGLARLSTNGIDIVLLDLNLPDSRGEATFDTLHAAFPDVPIVVLTGEYDEGIGPATVANGAQDYLVKQGADSASLSHVLRYALIRHRTQREKLKELQLKKSGRILGFVGAKGGVGTTTTALNMAVALAMGGKTVILAELRPSFGTLAFHLRQQPARSLVRLLKLPPDQIGRHELNSVLCKGPAGVWILFGPKEDEDYQDITPEQSEAIIKGLGQLAEIVILDLPSQLSPASRAATNFCHYAAVITEREPSSSLAARVAVKHLQTWGSRGNFAGGIVLTGTIIVNRTIYTNSISFSDMQAQLGCDVVGIIPFGAMEHQRALAEGIPLVLLLPNSDAAISCVEIAQRLAADTVVGLPIGYGSV